MQTPIPATTSIIASTYSLIRDFIGAVLPQKFYVYRARINILEKLTKINEL